MLEIKLNQKSMVNIRNCLFILFFMSFALIVLLVVVAILVIYRMFNNLQEEPEGSVLVILLFLIAGHILYNIIFFQLYSAVQKEVDTIAKKNIFWQKISESGFLAFSDSFRQKVIELCQKIVEKNISEISIEPSLSEYSFKVRLKTDIDRILLFDFDTIYNLYKDV